MNPYETEKLVSEYLLFHYGSAEEILPHASGPREALEYPARCVRECLETTTLPVNARALDLGCAVGRSTFELARHCAEVIGIDYSQRFIETARHLQQHGTHLYSRVDEGALRTALVAHVPEGIDRSRVHFEHGDATALRSGLGRFDVILMANLIDRLPDPRKCLAQLSSLLVKGGQLIVTSPYTWLEEFTPREKWLGGYERDSRAIPTLEGLHSALDRDFVLTGTRELPFLIREHARKYQWSVAQASLWRCRVDL